MINANDLYLDMVTRMNAIDGAVVTGENINIYESHLNAALRQLEIDAVAGKSTINPLKLQLVQKSLSGSQARVSYKDMIVGTYLNGALRGPDFDGQSIDVGQPTTQWGWFMNIPDEALKVQALIVDIRKEGRNDRSPVDVVPIYDLTNYSNLLHNHIKRPNENIVWYYLQRAGVPAGAPGGGWDSARANPTDGMLKDAEGNSLYELDGKNWDLEPVTLTGNVAQIICGDNWRPLNVTVYYIKGSNPIHIDLIDPSRAIHSDLHDSLRDDIIDIAVQRYTASTAVKPEGFQVQDKLANEN